MGLTIDETGGIERGKLIWSDMAWKNFLGRTPDMLARANDGILRYLDSRLVFLKLTILFGWDPKVGRLLVLRAQTV